MKFDLTLTTVLVFFVPGAILLLAAPPLSLLGMDSWEILKRPHNATDIALLLSLLFLCGALVDSVRTVTIQPLVRATAKKVLKSQLSTSYFQLLNDKSLPVFSMLVDRAFEYHRLNQNITVVLAALLALRTYLIAAGQCIQDNLIPWIWTISFAVVWFIISVNSQRSLNTALSGFITAQEQKGI